MSPDAAHKALFRDNARGSLNLLTAEIKYQPVAVAEKLEKAHFCSLQGSSPKLGQVDASAVIQRTPQGCTSSPACHRARKIVFEMKPLGGAGSRGDAGAVLAALLLQGHSSSGPQCLSAVR